MTTQRTRISADMLRVLTSEHDDASSIGALPVFNATHTRSDESHEFVAYDETAARHWVMDHLDVSLDWTVEQDHGTFSVPVGNVAANVYNVTQGSGLEGLNLGWKGMEASTNFLCSIVTAVDEAWTEIVGAPIVVVPPEFFRNGWDELRDNGRDHEIADGAVPISNHDRVIAALELNADVEDPGLLPETPGMGDFAGVALYELASSIVHGLMDKLIERAGAVTV
jgi:hypothetical protein